MYIFDLDGTLLDSQEGVLYSLQFSIGKHAPDYLPLIHKGLIGPPISVLLKKITSDENLIKTISTEFRSHYDNVGYLKTKLFIGVYDGLKELSKNSKLFVATNKPWKSSQKILSMLKIDIFFDAIITIDSEGIENKSDMASNILLTNDNKSCVLVGDSIDDFEAAKNNQIDFIYCSYGYGLIQDTKGIEIASSAKQMFTSLLTMQRISKGI
jgi:phosphoglycolate phosphatase